MDLPAHEMARLHGPRWWMTPEEREGLRIAEQMRRVWSDGVHRREADDDEILRQADLIRSSRLGR